MKVLGVNFFLKHSVELYICHVPKAGDFLPKYLV